MVATLKASRLGSRLNTHPVIANRSSGTAAGPNPKKKTQAVPLGLPVIDTAKNSSPAKGRVALMTPAPQPVPYSVLAAAAGYCKRWP